MSESDKQNCTIFCSQGFKINFVFISFTKQFFTFYSLWESRLGSNWENRSWVRIPPMAKFVYHNLLYFIEWNEKNFFVKLKY